MSNITILYSEVPVSDTVKIPCSVFQCSNTATHFWPGTSENPEPYCKEHLAKAQQKLSVALGLASSP